MISLHAYLVVAALLFCFGLLNVMTRRNAIGILMGVEMILNAAAINWVAFGHFRGNDLGGTVFALFLIVLAAAEAAVALAIVLSIYRLHGSIDVNDVSEMKG